MSDGRFFATTKRGETAELKTELRGLDKAKRKEACKRVIAMMTVGQDVSALFPDVVNCMQTDDLELKKLVYLYLINYAKTQPDLAIMAVNTFVKDSTDPNPLIRALAVRTMGCIRVDKITEYLCDPLQNAIKDADPYVRKTAAICIAKLYDINPEMVVERNFLEDLKDMLQDSNPMVVSNAVAALSEISSVSGRRVLQLTTSTLYKLLTALNECNEWGQVFLLDCIADAEPTEPKEAETIIDRVMPRLQHANSGVVLSAVKVIMKLLDQVQNTDKVFEVCRKMAPSLVTLLTAEPEIQYVALRNINLIVQRRPEILQNEVKVFFCKYNDPIYVKMEKLEIMIKLAADRNIDQVLLELKEYAQEVDMEFVRKSVRSIGRCAISLEKAAQRCINVLLELIKTRVNYVVQESIVVIKDIFRRYPNKYESIIAELCENLDSLDEPEAKASMIWIIGEYADRIDNADELLESFLEGFPEETSQVQLQLLTATVKLFLKKPEDKPQQMISLVLSCATQETDNPDLRDRAYIYWRLLSSDPEAAKDIVLAEKPVITDASADIDKAMLDKLLSQVSMLSSVYHKPPEAFVSRTRLAVQKADDLPNTHEFEEEEGEAAAAETSAAADVAAAEPEQPAAPAAAAAPVDLLGDLLGDGPEAAAPAAVPNGGLDDLLGGLSLDGGAPAAPVATGIDDLFGPTTATPSSAAGVDVQLPVILTADKGFGCAVKGKVVCEGGRPVYKLAFQNSASQALDGFMIQINRNAFGLQPATPVVAVAPVQPGQTGVASVPLTVAADKVVPASGPQVSTALQVALKYNQLPPGQVLYFQDMVDAEALFNPAGQLQGTVWLQQWQALGHEQAHTLTAGITDANAIAQKLQSANIFVVAQRPVPGTPTQVFFLCCQVLGDAHVLLELKVTPGNPHLPVSGKSSREDYIGAVFSAVQRILH